MCERQVEEFIDELREVSIKSSKRQSLFTLDDPPAATPAAHPPVPAETGRIAAVAGARVAHRASAGSCPVDGGGGGGDCEGEGVEGGEARGVGQGQGGGGREGGKAGAEAGGAGAGDAAKGFLGLTAIMIRWSGGGVAKFQFVELSGELCTSW
jgi:hypothetical protein